MMTTNKTEDNSNNSWIILDTNFLINSARNLESHLEVLTKFQATNIITLDLVQIEFYKGADTSAQVHEKTNLFESLVAAALPSASLIHEVKTLLLSYRKSGGTLSVTDLFLAAALKTYNSALLLTENLKDFPQDIFDWIEFTVIPGKTKVFTYGFIRFNKEKFDNQVAYFMKSK